MTRGGLGAEVNFDVVLGTRAPNGALGAGGTGIAAPATSRSPQTLSTTRACLNQSGTGCCLTFVFTHISLASLISRHSAKHLATHSGCLWRILADFGGFPWHLVEPQ